MNEQRRKRISKRMSLVLRHDPESVGLMLEEGGWVSVEGLIAALEKHGVSVDYAMIEEVVVSNDKQRFEFDEAGKRIRARQGHSVDVALGYEPQAPPAVLLHGTAEGNLESIKSEGIHKAKRHAVHMSTNAETMLAVGRRHGRPVLVEIDAAGMHAAGFHFYLTGNNVWLTDVVPPEYLLRHLTKADLAGRRIE